MSRKRYRRKINATFCPQVTAQSESNRITVVTGGFQGLQRYDIAASMSIYTARTLILNLRLALREVRDDNVRDLNEAVAEAEKLL
jgi:hypothetical protein